MSLWKQYPSYRDQTKTLGSTNTRINQFYWIIIVDGPIHCSKAFISSVDELPVFTVLFLSKCHKIVLCLKNFADPRYKVFWVFTYNLSPFTLIFTHIDFSLSWSCKMLSNHLYMLEINKANISIIPKPVNWTPRFFYFFIIFLVRKIL